MDAMNYEYLIRRVHNCGRSHSKGADADIYRRFERKFRIYTSEKKAIENNTPRSRSQDILDIEDEYRMELATVSGFVSSAIRKFLDGHAKKLNGGEFQLLKKHLEDLDSPTMESLKKAIEDSEKIMLDLGLFPG